MDDEVKLFQTQIRNDEAQLNQLQSEKIAIEERTHIGFADAVLASAIKDEMQALEIKLVHEKEKLAADRG